MNEAENRKLAEWLEPLLKQKISRVNGEAFAGTLWTAGRGWDSQPSHDKFYPRYDFYEDEKANALLFEKLPEPSLRYYRYIREWGCLPNWEQMEQGRAIRPSESMHKFRKAAICEAALQRIERGETSG